MKSSERHTGADPSGRTRGANDQARRVEALDENVREIKAWEQAVMLQRSRSDQLSDWIACRAGSGSGLILHLVWFGSWIAINTGLMPFVPRFDPFPFPLLTTAVSLEAIFLALFVLASQNRLARQSDMRSRLDLQIDLLAEREMTAMLQMLQDVTRHLGVQTTITSDQLRDLAKKTDIHRLTQRLDAIADDRPSASG